MSFIYRIEAAMHDIEPATEQRADRLRRIYQHGTREQRWALDQAFLALCGRPIRYFVLNPQDNSVTDRETAAVLNGSPQTRYAPWARNGLAGIHRCPVYNTDTVSMQGEDSEGNSRIESFSCDEEDCLGTWRVEWTATAVLVEDPAKASYEPEEWLGRSRVLPAGSVDLDKDQDPSCHERKSDHD